MMTTMIPLQFLGPKNVVAEVTKQKINPTITINPIIKNLENERIPMVEKTMMILQNIIIKEVQPQSSSMVPLLPHERTENTALQTQNEKLLPLQRLNKNVSIQKNLLYHR